MTKRFERSKRAAGAAVLIINLGAALAVHAVPFTYELTFATSGQSIWDTGTSSTLNQSTFLGAAWNDQKVDIDLLVGDEGTQLPNPFRGLYDAAFTACTALGFSANACINGQSGQVYVPALGSRPTVRSCGTFAVACQIARVGDLARRAAYDVAFAACTGLGSSSTVCRNGQSLRLPVVALGTAPPQYLEVDTRTGVAVNGTTDGRVGIELGVEIDSGSVAATVSYLAELEIPDTTNADKSIPINFNPQSLFADINSLNTTFPTLKLSVDGIMELSGNVSAEACAIGAGCLTGATPFNIAEEVPIVSFNQDGEGGILLFGQSPSNYGLPGEADGFPFTLDVAGLAEVTLHLPQPNASGGLDTSTGKLTASAQDDLVDLILDLDNIVATAAGVPGLFGDSLSFGPFEAGFDIINVAMGPTIDLKQDFELDPTLFVNLLFDQPVVIGGFNVSEWTSPWDMLPDVTFLSDVTTVTPTFFLDALLLNNTSLDFDLEFFIDLLQIYWDAGLLGDGQLGIGNVLSKGIDLFTSPAFFSNLFPLGGFNLQIGDSFVIDFGSNGSRQPSSAIAFTADNPDAVFDDTIPEPRTALLLAAGLFGLYALRFRPRVAVVPRAMA